MPVGIPLTICILEDTLMSIVTYPSMPMIVLLLKLRKVYFGKFG